MSNRFHPVSARWVLTLCLLPAAFSAFVSLRVDDRVRLGAHVLAGSRGRNAQQVLTQSYCITYNGLYSCLPSPDGYPCVACDNSTYTNVTPGANGGYSVKGNNTLCGVMRNGTCMSGMCATSGGATGQCLDPTVYVQ